MDMKMSEEQIDQVVRAARILAPEFNRDQLEWLISAQQHLAESGFCEAVWGLVRLQQERGITCAEALDAYKGLLQEKDEVQGEVDQLREEARTLKNANEEAREENQRIKNDTEQAKKELAETKQEGKKEKRKLERLHEKEEKEKERVDKGIEAYRQKAEVSKEEIATAGELKKDLAHRGLTLELVLQLSQQFAGYEDCREGLAEVLKQYRSLTEYVAAEKKRQQSQLKTFESQRDELAAQVGQLRESSQNLKSYLAQLRADAAGEEELRRFYYRYRRLSPLAEYMAKWDQMYFFRCNNTLSAMAAFFEPSARGPRIISDKIFARCPHCGLRLPFDEEAYQELNLPVGYPMNLYLEHVDGKE